MAPAVPAQQAWWRSPRVIGAALVVVVAAAIALTTKYVPYGSDLDAPSGPRSGADPVAYAAENWSSAIVPGIEDAATDWATLSAAIADDAEAAGQQYGHREDGVLYFTYPVRVSGTVAEGRFGEVEILADSPGGDGVSVGMQVGPAINGTAVRDATGLVTFGMFTNQTDYQTVGSELNAMVKSAVLADFDAEAALGSHIEVTGAFIWDGSGHISIVPVRIEVSP
jgi:predicted lipoprotein